MALATLKPRLAVANTSAVPIMQSGSWRTEGMTAHQRGYTYAWTKARAGWLRKHPLCVYCQKEGRTTAASVVDHITPHRGDKVLFWDSANNWQSLCKDHHDGQKAREEAGAHQ